MRRDLFAHLSRQPMRYFSDQLAGALGQRLTSTAGYTGALTNTIVWRSLPPLIDFTGALIVFITINTRMALALAAFVCSVTAALHLIGLKGRPLHQLYAHKQGRVAGELSDVISNMWAVKAFSAYKREESRLLELFKSEAASQRTSWMYTEAARFGYDLLLVLILSGMLIWAISLWTQAKVTTGDVVVVSTMTFRILHGTRDFVLSLVDVAQQIGFIQDTLHIIAQPCERDIQKRARARDRNTVEFDGVAFSYDSRPVLQDLSLSVTGGEKLGIVGPSGAGKSTIILALQRLYPINAGEILIGGQPLSSIPDETLRDLLSVVPQDITLFHRSIAENIRFGRPDATLHEISRAAQVACCDFIEQLPQGFDTIVGERGSKLSGGQRQRIGIARALLRDSPILLLDEATSALDSETEGEVLSRLLTCKRERTIIAVSHRLSAVSAFDRILVLEHGQVVEDGSWGQLKSGDGLFSRMWRLQADGRAHELG